MPHYLVEYRELGNAEARARLRDDHIGYRRSLGMAMTGPLLDDDDKPVGSVVIIEADGQQQAEDMAGADPYVGAGVLECVSVRKYRIASMRPPQG